MFAPSDLYDILTPTGFRPFAGIQKLRKRTAVLYTSDGSSLEAADTHRVLTPDGFVLLGAIELGQCVCLAGGGITHVVDIQWRDVETDVFDPVDVAGDAFTTNNFISHNCSFQGSANTLIPAYKLAQMVYQSPVEVRGDLKIYTKPIRADANTPSHVYVATVDTSQGQEQDYSIVNVFDVSVSPFRQVAVFRKNNIAPQLFAPIVRDILRHYCNAFVLIEINDVGIMVADMLHAELEYENIICVKSHPKRGQIMAGNFVPKARLGLRVTQATKRIGCAALRAMIEKDQLVLFDYDTIHELTTFVLNGSRYEASPGKHDDIVMTMVLMGWLSGQQGFEDYIGLSMRKALMNQYEPVTLDEPFAGIFDPPPDIDWGDPSGYPVVRDDDFWK